MDISSDRSEDDWREFILDANQGRRSAQLGFDDWVEIDGEEQGRIRKVSKSEISKNFLSLAKECQENLKNLTKWYVNDGGNGDNPSRLPLQVIGDQAFKCSIPASYLSQSNCFNTE